MPEVVVAARGLSRDYRLPKERLLGPAPLRRALVDVDLEVYRGEALAIIGESGSGKSTLIRLLLALDTPTAGSVEVLGQAVDFRPRADLSWLRRASGIVFQDPYASLDPRHTVGRIIREPLRALNIQGDHTKRVQEVLREVNLDTWRAAQYPHELSGGQRQRVALARALAHRPQILIGDEPLSALDVTVRAQILAQFRRLHRELNLTLILVSHDIGLVQHIADRIVVMREGRIVESGSSRQILSRPEQDYTRLLLASVPTLPAAAEDGR